MDKQIIGAGVAGVSLVAAAWVGDHLPLRRLKAIAACDEVSRPRSTLAEWIDLGELVTV